MAKKESGTKAARVSKALPANRRSARPGMPLPRPTPMKEMGSSGISIWGGYIPTIERHADWVGANKYRTASEIVTNVSIVAASVHHFLNLLAHPKWTVRASDDENPEAVELAEFVQDVIDDMVTPWEQVVRKAGMFRFHGFGIQEWTAKKRDDGQIGLLDVESRPQHTIERWEMDEGGKVLGVWQRNPTTGALLGLPRSKVVYLVENTLTDHPEGLGMFRHLAEPYSRLKQFLELEARTFERDLRGIPVGRAPLTLLNKMVTEGTITQEDADALVNGLKDFVQMELKKSDTGVVLDSQPYESMAADGAKVAGVMQWAIELLTGPANGLAELSHAIDRLQREMARILGTEHIMMGDAGGNRALATDKSRNLYLVANSVLGMIRAGMDHDVIEMLWILNAFPPELKPHFEVEEVAFKDVQEVTVALRDMATAGAVLMPDDPAINDVRDLLGISRQPEPDLDLLGALSRSGMEQEEEPGGEGGPEDEELEEGEEDKPPAKKRKRLVRKKVRRKR